MKPDKNNVRKILVVTLSNLGDVVLTLPVFQSLAQAFPGAQIHAIVGAGAREALEGDTRIQKVIPYNKRMRWAEKIKFLGQIRQERYDLIIDLRHSLIGFFGGARFRNSYFNFSRKRGHRAGIHLRSLRGIAPALEDGGSFLSAKALAGGRVEEWLLADERRLVVAAPGSKSDIKKWPAEYYAKLLDRLVTDHNCRVILVGDQQDAQDAAKVKGLMRNSAMDLAGQTNFKELSALLKNAALLITNDSAPLHIADALKTPTLALFGPTDPRKYGPRFSGSLVAKKEIFCSPCEKAQCRFGHECLKELGVDEVTQKGLQILNDEFQPRNLKILVVRLDRMGDVVLSLPAIEAIKNRFPNAFLSVMVRPYTREIVEGHPLVDEVIPYFYEKKGRHSSLIGGLRFVREIVKRHFDIAFILHPSNRSHLVPFLAGIPYRIGLGSHAPFLLTKRVPDRRHEGKKHESDYALDVVRAFGIQPLAEKKILIATFAEHESKASRILEDTFAGGGDELIAFHAGASCPSKRWPEERFAELGKKVLENSSYRVVIVGGKEDEALGQTLKATLGEKAVDLTGKLSLKELAALLKRCRLMVSNDSGPAHIAAAVGTPVICIFGRNQAGLGPLRWRPLGKSHEILHKDVGCVVCLAHRCTIGFECLQAITVEEVFSKLKQMLSLQKETVRQ